MNPNCRKKFMHTYVYECKAKTSYLYDTFTKSASFHGLSTVNSVVRKQLYEY